MLTPINMCHLTTSPPPRKSTTLTNEQKKKEESTAFWGLVAYCLNLTCCT